MTNFETVLEVEHYTDDLFWFRTTKSEEWNRRNFVAGMFTMIGMGDDDVQRAYSIACSPAQPTLEFLSIKVPDGPLTSRLQHIKPGDKVEVSTRSTGTLLIKNLTPAKRLWMISTGTGLAPFLSIARDQEVYNNYNEIIVTHTCRTNAELVFRTEIESHGARVYQTVTREEPTSGRVRGRITDRISNGSLFHDLGIDQTQFDPAQDRIMICGGPDFNRELRSMLEDQGWTHGTTKTPGEFVQERAFVLATA